MSNTKVRVVGSNYTVFSYRGTPLAFLEQVSDSGQKPISGQPFEAIIPLGAMRPVEIVTQRILGVGTLTLTIRELWNEPIWWQLAGLEGTDTVADVFEQLRLEPSYVTCTRIIQPPDGSPARGTQYLNCVVVAIDDGDQISVGALSVAKTIQIVYTHKQSF